MKSFEQQLTQYAAYHRDPRNIATHFAGVPMIMFSVVILLSRPVLFDAGLPVTAALITAVVVGIYYLRLHAGTGLLMGLVLAAMLYFGHLIGQSATGSWLGWGAGLFVVGWIIQAVGHIYEGRKPAFADDLMGLVIGPLFVLCEALFALGLLSGLRAAIENKVGATRRHQPNAAA
jgi:uncharacterized membrane protein YGL010W